MWNGFARLSLSPSFHPPFFLLFLNALKVHVEFDDHSLKGQEKEEENINKEECCLDGCLAVLYGADVTTSHSHSHIPKHTFSSSSSTTNTQN